MTLTPDQVLFIRETLDSLHNGIGEPADTGSRRAFSGAVCKKANALFTRVAASRIFAYIGPVDPRPARVHEASLIGGLVDQLRDLGVKAGVRKPPTPKCVCNVNSLCDCTASETSACVYDQPAGICIVQGEGCGCFGVFECNGSQCYDPER